MGLLAVAARAQVGAGVALTEGHFDDPFAYCEAVGTIDAPDARYSGPALPEPIARGLKAALAQPADGPVEPLLRNSIWRCMDGKVYACTVGANLPCAEKADQQRAPAPALTDFCRQNPGAEVIPMAVTGRAPVFAWRCTGGAPGDCPSVRATGQGGLSREHLVRHRPSRALNLQQTRARSWRYGVRRACSQEA
jgi:hypothetical protein